MAKNAINSEVIDLKTLNILLSNSITTTVMPLARSARTKLSAGLWANHSLAEGSPSPVSPVNATVWPLKKYTAAIVAARKATTRPKPREWHIRVIIELFIAIGILGCDSSYTRSLPMSRRLYLPSKLILSSIAYDDDAAEGMSSPNATVANTRPPAVTTRPSASHAVPA